MATGAARPYHHPPHVPITAWLSADDAWRHADQSHKRSAATETERVTVESVSSIARTLHPAPPLPQSSAKTLTRPPLEVTNRRYNSPAWRGHQPIINASSDIDLFLYGLTTKAADEKLKEIYEAINARSSSPVLAVKVRVGRCGPGTPLL